MQSAISIFLGQRTPFSSDELLVYATENAAPAASRFVDYTIRAVPVSAVLSRLTELGVRPSQICRLGLEGADGVDFAWGLCPQITWYRWSFIVPVVVGLVALGYAASHHLAEKANHVASLQSEMDAALARLRAIEAELDVHSKSAAGAIQVAEMFGSAPGAFAALLAARELLPARVAVARLQVASDGTRLTIKASDIIEVVQIMGQSDTWVATVDGPITADPASGGEAATVLLRGPS